MKLDYTSRSLDVLRDMPAPLRKAFYKQAGLLADNLHHPSLRAKKYDEARKIWQARVTRQWRFYFIIQGDTYLILDIMSHPK
jgi:hypothetical protein